MSGLLFFTLLAAFLVAFFVGLCKAFPHAHCSSHVMLAVTMAIFAATIMGIFIELLLAEHAPHLRAMLY